MASDFWHLIAGLSTLDFPMISPTAPKYHKRHKPRKRKTERLMMIAVEDPTPGPDEFTLARIRHARLRRLGPPRLC